MAWPMVSEVVKIDPENDGCVVLIGDRLHGIHQRVFAVEAAVRIVHAIRRILHFGGENFAPVETPLTSQTFTIKTLVFGE